MEEIGVIRRTIQDVLVPEMQGIKERLAGHDEKFVSIQQRFDAVDRRLDAVDRRLDALEKRMDALEKTVVEGFAALRATLDRIEARMSYFEFDKRLLRLEILHEHGSGAKPSAA